jgi:PAS domain S-box-containing protein
MSRPLFESQESAAHEGEVRERPGAEGGGVGGRGESLREFKDLVRANEELRALIEALERHSRIQQAFFDLSKEFSLELREVDLVTLAARTLAELCPERYFALRIVDPRTRESTSVVVEGPLAGALGGPIVLKRTAVSKLGLSQDLVASGRVRIVDRYEPLFLGSRGGVAIPLVASGELFGVMNVEIPPLPNDSTGSGAASTSDDETLLIPLCNQLSVAIRNRKLIEETLFLKEYLEQLVESVSALIVVVDRSGRITVFNRGIAELTGFHRRDMLGGSLTSWLAEEDRPALLRAVADALERRATPPVELTLPRRAGASAGVEEAGRAGEVALKAVFSFAPLTTHSGEVAGVIATGQDVTRIKLLERQVIHAEKLATLGQLAAGVVHELNNPLTSISVYGEFLYKKLERQGGDAQDLAKMAKIVEGASRIRQFARDLISYAKPASEARTLLSINDVIEQSLSFCEHTLSKANAKVKRRLSRTVPMVYGVKGQLQQVLINLITNASHSLGDDGGHVGVSSQLDQTRHVVVVQVSDTGCGVTPELAHRIFEPFFTTKTEGKGTGLGLSIVRNIVELHQGTIRFESVPGEGTSFFLALPAAASEHSDDDA